MTEDTMAAAEREARRFLDAAKALRQRRTSDGENGAWITGCRESGALRRASLDLTRALAAMRRSS